MNYDRVHELLNLDNFGRSLTFYVHHSSMAAEFVIDKKVEGQSNEERRKLYHPLKEKKTDAKEIQQYDVVLTTYAR